MDTDEILDLPEESNINYINSLKSLNVNSKNDLLYNRYRKKLVNDYSWGIPNHKVISILSNYNDLVEFGSGNGYWTYEIRKRDGEVECYDINKPNDTWTDVIEKDCLELDKNIQNVLFVWPPARSELSIRVAKKYNPNNIFYCGILDSNISGCKEEYNYYTNNYSMERKINIPSYPKVNDVFYHFNRD
jgi:hypothetical protein